MRPGVPPVKKLLREGRRMTAADSRALSARLLFRESGEPALAISVPKRHLKRAVDRNRLKRLVRESFRLGPAAPLPVDLLVLLNTSSPRLTGRDRASRRTVRREIDALMVRIAAAGPAVGPVGKGR